jgi:hypothetical protein
MKLVLLVPTLGRRAWEVEVPLLRREYRVGLAVVSFSLEVLEAVVDQDLPIMAFPTQKLTNILVPHQEAKAPLLRMQEVQQRQDQASHQITVEEDTMVAEQQRLTQLAPAHL